MTIANASDWLQDPSLLREQCFVAGEWVDGSSTTTIEVNNPATNEVLGRVPSLDAEATLQAIEAAERSWPDWRNRSTKDRAAILRRWHDLIIENTDDPRPDHDGRAR